MGRLSVHP